MNQVAAVLAAVDPNAEERLGGCLQRVETRFIEPSEITFQASTVRNHLFGLKRFCDFLILKESQNLSTTEHDRFDRQIDIWIGSLSKDVRKRSVVKGAEDARMYQMQNLMCNIVYLSYNYHTFIIYLSYIYHTFIIFLSYIYHTFIIHLSYIYHTFIIYLSYIYHTFIIHLAYIYHIFIIHLSYI